MVVFQVYCVPQRNRTHSHALRSTRIPNAISKPTLGCSERYGSVRHDRLHFSCLGPCITSIPLHTKATSCIGAAPTVPISITTVFLFSSGPGLSIIFMCTPADLPCDLVQIPIKILNLDRTAQLRSTTLP